MGIMKGRCGRRIELPDVQECDATEDDKNYKC